MTAPATDAPAVDIPQDAAPISLPVMVVEGLWTSDGRFIEPGSLSTGVMPITLFSQTRSSHGSLDGDTATVIVGAITHAERIPGPEVTQLTTGQPFPDGTFVWKGTGWMYKDVPAPPDKSAYQLVHDQALRGNSVDLAQVDAEFEYDDGQDLAADPSPARIVITAGQIGATTLVGQPAFPDAYIVLEGQAMALATPEEALAASAVPMWRSAETGDQCAPCTASAGVRDADVLALGAEERAHRDADGDVATSFLLTGADIDPEDLAPVHTGGMVALVPANPNMLLVPGGDPADELHLTLCYLGDDVSTWRPEDRAAVQRIALEATDWQAVSDRLTAEATDDGSDSTSLVPRSERSPAQRGPLDATIFSHAIFNPNGDNGFDPATVYMLDGTGDRWAIEGLAEQVGYEIRDAIGTTQYPEQHTPFLPHITAGYGVPVDQLTYTGPVQFDRLRVALGDEVTDYPLGGGGALTASAVPLPRAEIFDNPNLDGPTAPTVEPDGRAYGHLACWGTCHIGFNGQCITPPRSPTGYAYFMVHTVAAEKPDGTVVDVPVGWGTIGTGHASIQRDALAAAEHYDNTGTVAFEYAVGEDAHGIWFAGRMLPGLPAEMEHKARGAVFSGDWRTIRGHLELVASLAVNVPGFPVPRVRVASGSPLAMVAAGVPAGNAELMAIPGETFAEKAILNNRQAREILEYVRVQRDSALLADNLREMFELVTGPVEMGAQRIAAALTYELDSDHPWFGAAFSMHIPKYIKRIAKHLQEGGMEEGHAIAAAKNAAQKMCDTGDLNFPGKQDVNPGSRAEACAAIAEWDAQKVAK